MDIFGECQMAKATPMSKRGPFSRACLYRFAGTFIPAEIPKPRDTSRT